MGNEMNCGDCKNVFNELNDMKLKDTNNNFSFNNQKGLKIGKTDKSNVKNSKFDNSLFESKFKEENDNRKEVENIYEYEGGLRISLCPQGIGELIKNNKDIKKSIYLDETIEVKNEILENGEKFSGFLIRIPDKDSSSSEKILLKDDKYYLVDGKGKIINSEKAIYEGNFENGYANGNGKLTYSNGDYYDGEWINDFPYGFGTQKKENIIYTGNFKKGLKDGEGEILLPDKSKYTGEFKEDNYCGFGKMFWENGMRYIGYWEKNKMNGKGEFIWPDNNKYKGFYYDGKKHGKGEFFYSNGLIYKGIWENGNQIGEGFLYKNDKLVLKGKWVDGKFNEITN